MDNDELQIKINEARAELPDTTRKAIDAVDWRALIKDIRGEEGYNFIQLGDLETETELLLCGLVSPEDYPRELEKRMGITKMDAGKLLQKMNARVFEKIKQKLIEYTGQKKASVEEHTPLENREEILRKIEKPEPAAMHPIFAQKLSGPLQMPAVKTDHSIPNVTPKVEAPSNKPAIDPYREQIEE